MDVWAFILYIHAPLLYVYSNILCTMWRWFNSFVLFFFHLLSLRGAIGAFHWATCFSRCCHEMCYRCGFFYRAGVSLWECTESLSFVILNVATDGAFKSFSMLTNPASHRLKNTIYPGFGGNVRRRLWTQPHCHSRLSDLAECICTDVCYSVLLLCLAIEPHGLSFLPKWTPLVFTSVLMVVLLVLPFCALN